MKKIKNEILLLDEYLIKEYKENTLIGRIFCFCMTFIICFSLISILLLIGELIK